MAAEDLRVVQEYGAEHAGELVGWVNTFRTLEEGYPDYIHATIGLARIGLQGAKYTYYEYQPGKHGFSSDSIQGFEDATELTISTADEREHIEVRAGKAPRWTRDLLERSVGDPYNIASRRFTDDFSHYPRPESGGGEWALGSQAIIGSIKHQLVEQQASYLYPIAYYTLAVMADKGMQLVDPVMHHQTAIELPLAQYRAKQLRSLLDDDRQMLHALTHYSAATHPENVENFVQQRRHMHETESELSQLIGVTAVRGRMALPIGQGRAGRTWPFMGADESNEDKAFGHELQALKSHNYGIPQNELRREIDELKERAAEASLQSDQLETLSVKEAGMLESAH